MAILYICCHSDRVIIDRAQEKQTLKHEKVDKLHVAGIMDTISILGLPFKYSGPWIMYIRIICLKANTREQRTFQCV